MNLMSECHFFSAAVQFETMVIGGAGAASLLSFDMVCFMLLPIGVTYAAAQDGHRRSG